MFTMRDPLLPCVLFAVVAGATFALVFALVLRSSLNTPRCRAVAECPTRVARMWTVGGADELSLVVWVRCGVSEQPWVIDTGFAGPPVLSLPWIALGSKGSSPETCERAYAATVRAMAARAPVGAQGCRRALERFMRDCNATSFTAGCTTTLLGIGSSSVSHSDMLLAPPLELLGVSGAFFSGRSCAGAPNADILSTTQMSTASLITCDWLRQNGPCVISPQEGELRVALDGEELLRARASSTLFANELSGGAFVARVHIGGRSFRLTVDTGSALTVSLGADAVATLQSCEAGEPMHVQQKGVNGERVCSSVVWSTMSVAGHRLQTPVFLNDHPLGGGVDGYIGLGVLQSFEMLVSFKEMYVRLVRDAVDARQRVTDSTRSGWCGVAPRCAPQK